jgi:hypothetical protein
VIRRGACNARVVAQILASDRKQLTESVHKQMIEDMRQNLLERRSL